MAYIGNTATTQAFTPAVDYFNGDGSTVAFTLSKPVASVAQVQAVIENVPQNPGSAYTVSGNTITFTSAPPSGTANIYVYYTSPITQVIAPSQGTVGTDQLAGGTVDTSADATINGLTVGKGAGNVATNTAVGVSALAANTTGENSVVIGYTAGSTNTTGIRNVAVGAYSMLNNASGGYLTAIGMNALNSNTTASYNTGVGESALRLNTTGANNTALGRDALYANTTASNNTAVGYQAGYSNTTARWNTFIGSQAGYSLTTGEANTFVGNGYSPAGYSITTGSKNTIIGGYTGNAGGLDIRTSSNYIVLSDGDGNPRLYVNNVGKTFIGPENTNQATFNVHSLSNYWSANFYNLTDADVTNVLLRHEWAKSSNNATQISFCQSNGTEVGSIRSNGSATSYNTSSDYRLKENVVQLTDAISRVKNLQPKQFNFIENPNSIVDGFLAHEVQSVVPEAVQGIKDEVDAEGNPRYQGIDQSKLVPLLTAALKEAISRIEQLEADVAALKGQ